MEKKKDKKRSKKCTSELISNRFKLRTQKMEATLTDDAAYSLKTWLF